MMTVQVRFYTDPACPWSWAAEPALRRLMWEFEGELEFVWVMGGLARVRPEYRDEEGGIGSAPTASRTSCRTGWRCGARADACDPRIWTQNPLDSTYPACQAVKAAAEQGWQAAYRYLRRVREGIMFERRSSITPRR